MSQYCHHNLKTLSRSHMKRWWCQYLKFLSWQCYSTHVCVLCVCVCEIQLHHFLWNISCINSLWPSDAIWRQISGSTLPYVTGLIPDGTKPLTETMLTNGQWVLCHSHESNFLVNTHDINLYDEPENYIFRIIATTPVANELRFIYKMVSFNM